LSQSKPNPPQIPFPSRLLKVGGGTFDAISMYISDFAATPTQKVVFPNGDTSALELNLLDLRDTILETTTHQLEEHSDIIRDLNLSGILLRIRITNPTFISDWSWNAITHIEVRDKKKFSGLFELNGCNIVDFHQHPIHCCHINCGHPLPLYFYTSYLLYPGLVDIVVATPEWAAAIRTLNCKDVDGNLMYKCYCVSQIRSP
jgi:hypothetical protein